MSPSRPGARERLLDAAERLFHTRGIAGTPVDVVLADAGVSTASLYAHFRGKDELVAAYLQRRMRRWLVVWDAEVQRHTDPQARLLAVLDALALFRADGAGDGRGCAFLAAAAEITDPEHPAHAVISDESSALDARLLARARDVPTADPPGLARQVRLAYDGALAGFTRRARSPAPPPDSTHDNPADDDPLDAARRLAATAVRAELSRSRR